MSIILKIEDLKKEKYGRLRILEEAPKVGYVRYMVTECDCGTVKTLQLARLRSGRTASCGCLLRESTSRRFTTHGKSASTDYQAWYSMKGRCHNENNWQFKDYGGRGITVCPEWQSFESYIRSVTDAIGARPPGMSLDRIDNDGGYSPDNVQWSTPKEQARNRRDNFMITYDDKTQTLQDWADELGMLRATIYARIVKYGWSTARALTTPVRKQ